MIANKKRLKTSEVLVGNIVIGGDNPIRIQSMTTANTNDINKTVEQILKLADEGCEIARVTVQGQKEALSCELIKNELIKKGYTIPLVADIHFFPKAAMVVSDFVDKVRINPGNYIDRRASFKTIEYTDKTYLEEIEKIEIGFTPLVLKCKKLKKAMRIGTNHGSLSDRIMSRYGNTPKGMVISAIEFAEVCRKNDYHNFLFSMKASNPIVMIEANRLLVEEMQKLGWNYPLHLGVTEAGEGEDGRIKSAIGIGSLLLDGIGDTVRVSLTEEPYKEIDPTRRLIALAEKYDTMKKEPFSKKEDKINFPKKLLPENFYNQNGSVILQVSLEDINKKDFLLQIGSENKNGKYKKGLSTVDGLFLNELPKNETSKNIIKIAKDMGVAIFSKNIEDDAIYVMSLEKSFDCHKPYAISVNSEENWDKLLLLSPQIIFLEIKDGFHVARKFISWLKEKNIVVPVILSFPYKDLCNDDLVINASSEIGSLFCDGLGAGISIKSSCSILLKYSLSFGILQAAGKRTTKTEFISCPGCGRTLFDLQETSKKIREKTSHLPGIKIAIMGCIVNGPGEMADADFGYVGAGSDKVNLYIGKNCVEKNIGSAEAENKLIELIKREKKWKEK